MGLTSKLDKLKLRSHDESATPVSPTNHHQQQQLQADTSEQFLDSENESGEDDDQARSILMEIISQLRPGMDLTRITLPTFILERKSMLERITNFFQIPNLLMEANRTQDPLLRFVNILKWYLASWHIAPKAVKKPLNPVLGEFFTCFWDKLPEGEGKAYYLSEQTSHHPPKSSYFYLAPEEKIRVDGIVIPKSRFLGNSSAAIMEGWGYVTLGKFGDEQYVMNQPNVYCRGILFGKMRTELGDHMVVRCEKNGFEADIEFKTKGFIGGTYDAIEGTIKDSTTLEDLYHLSGKWNEVMYIKNVKTGKKEVLFDTAKTLRVKPLVRPLNEQAAFESRKLWKPTTDALAKKDQTTATEEKFKVENEQREMAKKRLEDGVEFHPRFFKPLDAGKQDMNDLEYIIYKPLELSEPSNVLTDEMLSVAPILPGQHYDDKFEIPAFKKQ